jgi:hypothetical protein
MNDDERWIETLREEFQPEPTSEARAAELGRELREGLSRTPPRASRFVLPALAAAAAAAAALYLATPHVTRTTADDAGATVAESDLLVDPDAYASELTDDGDYLPADYQGLALLLDEDGADR